MKTASTFLLVAGLVSIAPALSAAPDARPSPTITERGPHHRVWTRTNVTTLLDGRARTNASSFVELGSGLHRRDARTGAWVDADVTIEIAGNTAVANKTAHLVTFAANANTAGCIDLVTPDGKRLRSHVLGIAWFDAASGRSEMIGELKDSIGEVHAPNVVIYPDAFEGLPADLRYTQRLGGFEQDVILREKPTLPAGFAPDTTRLEVWTEFIEHPGATLTQRNVPGMTDDTLDFGTMQTGEGRAFSLADEPARSVGVAKRWLVADGRNFLVEAVRYLAAKPELDRLPVPQAQAAPRVPHPEHAAGRPFPSAPRQARANQPAEKFRLAASSPSPLRGERAGVRGPAPNPQLPPITTNASLNLQPSTFNQPRLGYVIDYTLYASLTNFTFQCDTTYYASNTVNFYGTTIFEGGTVVKFAKTNTASLVMNGSPEWRTAQYRPAIFTARDDNTVGATVTGSTGTPSGYYGGVLLSLTSGSGSTSENLRVSHARTVFQITSHALTIRHAQFVSCSNIVDATGVWTGPRLTLENVLLHNVQSVQAFNYSVGYFVGTHLTISGCGTLTTNSGGAFDWTGELNNSIIYSLGGWGGEEPTLNECYTDLNGEEDSPFQTVGAAAHYLVANSSLRDVGNPLSGALTADIKKRTTYPPIIFAGYGWYTNDVTLSPQALRDTDTPDLGYHYDPLDFALNGIVLTNSRMTILAGTAVATFATNSTSYALVLGDNSRLDCHGFPTNLNRIVRYNTVQEQANSAWTNPVTAIIAYAYSGGPPSVTLASTFTEWCSVASDSSHFYGWGNIAGTVGFRDCQFFGGYLTFARATTSITNCLFQRTGSFFEDGVGSYDAGHSSRHSLFYGGYLDTDHCSADAWVFRDNVFAGISYLSWCNDPDADYNAYTTNVTRLNTSATHDKLLATNDLNFQVGALGRFYLPTNGPATNLLNTGSTYATNVGLYHFTTTTNQWKETNSIVDIGFHYVAVGTNGLPVDTDSDGWPDYWEDVNGNGSLDHRETKPNDAADAGLRVFITRPKSGSTIP